MALVSLVCGDYLKERSVPNPFFPSIIQKFQFPQLGNSEMHFPYPSFPTYPLPHKNFFLINTFKNMTLADSDAICKEYYEKEAHSTKVIVRQDNVSQVKLAETLKDQFPEQPNK